MATAAAADGVLKVQEQEGIIQQFCDLLEGGMVPVHGIPVMPVGWKRDFFEEHTPVMPVQGWIGDDLLKKSGNLGCEYFDMAKDDDDIDNEFKNMLVKVGLKKDSLEKNIHVMPVQGWMGGNLLMKFESMAWSKGQEVELGSKKIHVDTVSDVLGKVFVKVGWKKDFFEKHTPVMPVQGWMGDNLKKSVNLAWWKGQDMEVDYVKVHIGTIYVVLDKLLVKLG
jgi:hypothetical protein